MSMLGGQSSFRQVSKSEQKCSHQPSSTNPPKSLAHNAPFEHRSSPSNVVATILTGEIDLQGTRSISSAGKLFVSRETRLFFATKSGISRAQRQERREDEAHPFDPNNRDQWKHHRRILEEYIDHCHIDTHSRAHSFNSTLSSQVQRQPRRFFRRRHESQHRNQSEEQLENTESVAENDRSEPSNGESLHSCPL